MDIKIFYQPFLSTLKASHPLQEWFGRMLYVLQRCGIAVGSMFVTPKGKAMSIWEMEDYSIPTLLEVQRKFSHIIPNSIDVSGEYSMY